MTEKNNHIIQRDEWQTLRSLTAARIALGRTGVSVPIQELLEFKMAHAHARDAVYSLLGKEKIFTALQTFGLPVFVLHSKAANRQIYLQRPDLGRRLNEISETRLTSFNSPGYDVCISIADGLSSSAVNMHAFQVLLLLLPMLQQAGLSLAPFCIIEQGRVAISDEAASLLKAKMSLIFIGERPGLSSPDSMGVYLTYCPCPGLTDEARNCISNIRPEGIGYINAAEKICYLVKEAFRLKLTGIQLKDNNKLLL